MPTGLLGQGDEYTPFQRKKIGEIDISGLPGHNKLKLIDDISTQVNATLEKLGGSGAEITTKEIMDMVDTLLGIPSNLSSPSNLFAVKRGEKATLYMY